MALFTSNLKTIYTDISTKNDSCYFCEIEILKQYEKKEINFDDKNKLIRELQGKMYSTRIVKINSSGRYICICQKCLSNINKEIFPNTPMSNKNQDENETKTTINEEESFITEEKTDNKDNKNNKNNKGNKGNKK